MQNFEFQKTKAKKKDWNEPAHIYRTVRISTSIRTMNGQKKTEYSEDKKRRREVNGYAHHCAICMCVCVCIDLIHEHAAMIVLYRFIKMASSISIIKYDSDMKIVIAWFWNHTIASHSISQYFMIAIIIIIIIFADVINSWLCSFVVFYAMDRKEFCDA